MKDTIKQVATYTNQAFLAFLLDFLNANSKEGREKFFHDNRKNMDTLVGYYWDEFKKGFYKKQSEKIKGYRDSICKRTGIEQGKKNEPNKWWLHFYDRVLGIYWKKKGEPRIGIECVFEGESHDNPLGLFHIYVASWDKPTFGPSEQQQAIDKAFPNKKDRGTKKRVFRLVAALAPDDKDIIPTLENTYNKLKEIIG